MTARRMAATARRQGAEHRYYVVATDKAPSGYEAIETAVNAARRCGEGAYIVDTLATPYFPMVRQIEKGEPVYREYGAWACMASLDRNLIEAVKKGCPAVVRAFLAKGADVNARDEQGGTALHWAVKRRVPECARQLIAAGADLAATDRSGLTALGLARAKNLPELAQLLSQAGAREQREPA